MALTIPFIKMHGCGNDYVFVETRDGKLPDDLPQLARRISDRHTGVGGDGLVLVEPPRHALADARMRIFNADGSEAEMCGNAVRCVARLLFERRESSGGNGASSVVETGRGLLRAGITLRDDQVDSVSVTMRSPILTSHRIPTRLNGNPPIDVPLCVGDQSVRVTCVSMGNPHCVLFSESVDDAPVERLGPIIEHHAAFPNRTNVEFVQVVSRSELRVRVWERGSGETQACGTGACAALVAGALTDRCQRRATVTLPGGRLGIDWMDCGEVMLSGPACEIFRGEWIEDGPEAGIR